MDMIVKAAMDKIPSTFNLPQLIATAVVSGSLAALWTSRALKRTSEAVRKLGSSARGGKGTGPGALNPQNYDDFKMVLVVRSDLGMTKGKAAAQCCHACLGAYKHCLNTNPSMAAAWEQIGQAKVALKCNSEEELLQLEAAAKKLKLSAKSILDAGRTQIAAGSRTVLAIGPGPVSVIDQVTAHLKLY